MGKQKRLNGSFKDRVSFQHNATNNSKTCTRCGAVIRVGQSALIVVRIPKEEVCNNYDELVDEALNIVNGDLDHPAMSTSWRLVNYTNVEVRPAPGFYFVTDPQVQWLHFHCRASEKISVVGRYGAKTGG
jgi:hypothetical protein